MPIFINLPLRSILIFTFQWLKEKAPEENGIVIGNDCVNKEI